MEEQNSFAANFEKSTVEYKVPAFSYANAAGQTNKLEKKDTTETAAAAVDTTTSDNANTDVAENVNDQENENEEQKPTEATETKEADDSNGNSDESKLVDTLVIDTNPLVKGIQLDHLAKKFVTIPEVIAEVKSKGAKENLETTLLKLNIGLMEPDAESIKFVMDFSKKTGDFSSLAIADIKVIALAYMLEKQKNGTEKLNKQPVKSVPKGGDIKQPKPNTTSTTEEGEAVPQEPNEEADAQAEDDLAAGVENLNIKAEDVNEEEEGESQEQQEQEQEDDGWEVVTKKKAPRKKKNTNFGFGGNWITPQNIKKQQARDGMNIGGLDTKTASGKSMGVACVTADFAMQNVLLQIGLHLLSPDGAIVKKLKTWVQRCQACFKLVPEMEKKFCPSCGHAALSRVSISVNDKGETKVYLKQNYQYRLKGTKYSIPKAQGGRVNNDIILREDDKSFQDNMHKWKIHQAKLSKENQGGDGVFSLDYIPSMWLGASTNNSLAGPNKNVATYNQVELDSRGLPVVGFGRKNPNKSRKTGNRKHKKK